MAAEGQRSRGRQRRRARTSEPLLVAPAGHARGKPHLGVERFARVAQGKMESRDRDREPFSYVATEYNGECNALVHFMMAISDFSTIHVANLWFRKDQPWTVNRPLYNCKTPRLQTINFCHVQLSAYKLSQTGQL